MSSKAHGKSLVGKKRIDSFCHRHRICKSFAIGNCNRYYCKFYHIPIGEPPFYHYHGHKMKEYFVQIYYKSSWRKNILKNPHDQYMKVFPSLEKFLRGALNVPGNCSMKLFDMTRMAADCDNQILSDIARGVEKWRHFRNRETHVELFQMKYLDALKLILELDEISCKAWEMCADVLVLKTQDPLFHKFPLQIHNRKNLTHRQQGLKKKMRKRYKLEEQYTLDLKRYNQEMKKYKKEEEEEEEEEGEEEEEEEDMKKRKMGKKPKMPNPEIKDAPTTPTMFSHLDLSYYMTCEPLYETVFIRNPSDETKKPPKGLIFCCGVCGSIIVFGENVDCIRNHRIIIVGRKLEETMKELESKKLDPYVNNNPQVWSENGFGRHIIKSLVCKKCSCPLGSTFYTYKTNDFKSVKLDYIHRSTTQNKMFCMKKRVPNNKEEVEEHFGVPFVHLDEKEDSEEIIETTPGIGVPRTGLFLNRWVKEFVELIGKHFKRRVQDYLKKLPFEKQKELIMKFARYNALERVVEKDVLEKVWNREQEQRKMYEEELKTKLEKEMRERLEIEVRKKLEEEIRAEKKKKKLEEEEKEEM